MFVFHLEVVSSAFHSTVGVVDAGVGGPLFHLNFHLCVRVSMLNDLFSSRAAHFSSYTSNFCVLHSLTSSSGDAMRC